MPASAHKRQPTAKIRLVDVAMDACCQTIHTTFKDKLAKASALAASGIDVLDVGDVLAVPGKLILARKIAATVRTIAVAARTQGNREDIQTACSALRRAEQPVLRVCVQISDWHREERLRVSENALQAHVRAMITYARELCPAVEFVAEDATRCAPSLLCQFIQTALEAGASTVTLADMIGYARPIEYRLLFRTVMEQVRGVDAITLGVAAHPRGGEALENTLAAIAAGARQVIVDESACGHLKRAELVAALQKLAQTEEETIPLNADGSVTWQTGFSI